MKQYFFCVLIFLFVSQVKSQEFVPSGKPFATIYANFHRGFTGTAKENAAFELVRGYIGYEYNLSPEFFAKINLDVGSPNDLSPYAKARRYAYFKNAFLQYKRKTFEVEFGLISLKQFKLQEDIWERRYLMKTLADEYQLGQSADLGVNVNYRFNDFIDMDFTMMNGEGYSSIQMDDIFKYGIGSTVKLPVNFTSRVFYEVTINEITEHTLLLFTSYDYRGKCNIAGEFLFRENHEWHKDHDIFGLSVYGKYNLTDKYQMFARYDRLTSNIPAGKNRPWNLTEDGTAVVAGLQFSPLRNIKMALNYHDWYPWAANAVGGAYIYLDLEVKM